MERRAVIFDLDGTLLDTLEDLADSCNQVLAEEGLPGHPSDSYRHFIGNGIAKLVERALPPGHAGPEALAALVERVRADYAGRWRAKTRPYDGIESMLAELSERGLRLAVLSNKPHPAACEVVAHFFPQVPFEQVAGARPGVALKPDPAAALLIAARMRLAPRDFCFLGDTAVDIKTALAAGMDPVGAGWGFRPDELMAAGARLVIGHPLQLLAGC